MFTYTISFTRTRKQSGLMVTSHKGMQAIEREVRIWQSRVQLSERLFAWYPTHTRY